MDHLSPDLAPQIDAIREFNRFYTARLGLLRRRHLDGAFSLTEARALYEIGVCPGTTASALRQTLQLDAGYLSRTLASLARRGLIRQAASPRDAREKRLTLTPQGQAAVDQINRASARQMRAILHPVSAPQREEIAACLRRVQAILSAPPSPPLRIRRLTELSGAALAILEEYYEAVHVVKRDGPDAMRHLIPEPDGGMWVAERGDDGNEIVGSVVLRPLESIARAAECKRLYVQPAARGLGIADRLMDALEDFARARGMEWIYLDSYDDLKPAIALYERRGYERCERYNDNPQATLFLRKNMQHHS